MSHFFEGPPGAWPDGARIPAQGSGAVTPSDSEFTTVHQDGAALERLRRRRDKRKIERAYRGDLAVPRGGDADHQREAARTTWSHLADAGLLGDAAMHTLCEIAGAPETCTCPRCTWTSEGAA